LRDCQKFNSLADNGEDVLKELAQFFSCPPPTFAIYSGQPST
jgi:hypothetical protein